MSAPRPIAAFWCRIPSRPNFGDALTPWLVRRITGRPPRFKSPEQSGPTLFATGSVIAMAGPGATVWGAGIMRRDDPICPQATLLAVRGPLTRARALACGVPCPEVFGDPALLLPRLYRPPPRPRAGIGVIPHFSDMPRLAGRVADHLAQAGARLIDIQQPIERVIDEITACEAVGSSSLHGLVVAHAYGVPAVWLALRELPSGDGSKFLDHFAAVGVEPTRLACPGDRIDVDAIVRHAALAPPFDAEPLWRACPLREGP